jgi:DNA-binding response OmpR family regulator
MVEPAPRADRAALVVDDDVFVVSALAELLADDGFDVDTATNGFTALRLALQLRPALVLLDLALPERSGMDLLADLRADPQTRDCAIVVVTGNPGLLSESITAEIDGLALKPFDIDRLMLTVHQALQRAAARRNQVAPIGAQAHPRTVPVRRGASGAHRARRS